MFREITSDWVLQATVSEDIQASDRPYVRVIAGHFPLVKNSSDEVVEGLYSWRAFTEFSWSYGCKAVREAKELGKDAKLIIIADDHTSLPKGSKWQRLRRGLYRKRSGKHGRLPYNFEQEMEKNGLDLDDVLRHDHGKRGRSDCLYFSEKVLQSQDDDQSKCARVYNALFSQDSTNSIIDPSLTQLIAFVPLPCQVPISSAARELQNIDGLESSHFFMRTKRAFDAYTLFGNGGVFYCKESSD